MSIAEVRCVQGRKFLAACEDCEYSSDPFYSSVVALAYTSEHNDEHHPPLTVEELMASYE